MCASMVYMCMFVVFFCFFLLNGVTDDTSSPNNDKYVSQLCFVLRIYKDKTELLLLPLRLASVKLTELESAT